MINRGTGRLAQDCATTQVLVGRAKPDLTVLFVRGLHRSKRLVTRMVPRGGHEGPGASSRAPSAAGCKALPTVRRAASYPSGYGPSTGRT